MKLQRIEINKDCKPFFIENSNKKYKVTGVNLCYKNFWSSKEILVHVFPTDAINYSSTSTYLFLNEFYVKFYDTKGDYIGSVLSEKITKYLRTQELNGLL